MATWTNLDASVDAGDPITTTLMQGLKDNPVAIAEGAANAPRLEAQAFGCAAGNLAVLRGELNTGLSTEPNQVDLLSDLFTFNRTGTVKIYYRVKIDRNQVNDNEDGWIDSGASRATFVGRLYINGSLAQSTQAVNRADGIGTYRSITLASQSVSAGDTIQFKLDRTDSNNSSQWRSQFSSNFALGLAADQGQLVSYVDPVLSAIT